MTRLRQTDLIDALTGALGVAYVLGSLAAIGAALGSLAH
jgi:hypothetical protein